MLSSDTNGWRREIKGLGAAAIPRRTLTGHYARREAISGTELLACFETAWSFLVAYTKVKISRVSGPAFRLKVPRNGARRRTCARSRWQPTKDKVTLGDVRSLLPHQRE